MTTLTYDNDLPLATVEQDAGVASTQRKATEKPGLFARIMEAIGRTYCVETADGEVYYFQPPF